MLRGEHNTLSRPSAKTRKADGCTMHQIGIRRQEKRIFAQLLRKLQTKLSHVCGIAHGKNAASALLCRRLNASR